MCHLRRRGRDLVDALDVAILVVVQVIAGISREVISRLCSCRAHTVDAYIIKGEELGVRRECCPGIAEEVFFDGGFAGCLEVGAIAIDAAA